MDYKLEVITLAVGDVDRAKRFYTEELGFGLDVDYAQGGYRVVQVTPPGSTCSIQFGRGLTDAEPGSARTTYLVVTDLEAAHNELVARGLKISGIMHKAPIDDWAGELEPGLDPDRRDYASMADLTDPDGNTWVLQEIGYLGSAG